MEGTIGGRIGNPFSYADLKNSIAANVKEIRAVARGYTYSLKRPSTGWPRGFARAYAEEVANNLTSYASAVRRSRGTLTHRYAIEADARNNVISKHRALRDMAKRYGVIYSWRKNS